MTDEEAKKHAALVAKNPVARDVCQDPILWDHGVCCGACPSVPASARRKPIPERVVPVAEQFEVIHARSKEIIAENEKAAAARATTASVEPYWGIC